MAMTLKQAARIIPHLDKPITKPIMKVAIRPELVLQPEVWMDESGIMWTRPVFPDGQKKFRSAHMNMFQFLDKYVSEESEDEPVSSHWTDEKFKYDPRGGILDVDHPAQRPSCQAQLEGTATTPTKSQGIMECVFDGLDIGEIKIRSYSIDEKTKYEIEIRFISEVEDGSNRVRAFIWFPNGKFSMRESYRSIIPKFSHYDFHAEGKFNLSTWPKPLIDYLKNYIVTVKVYEDMTAEEGKAQFDYTNKNTKQSDQQNRNGHGYKNLAIMVRDFVRDGHELFQYTINEKTGRHDFEYFTGTNDLLQLEEMVSQICYRYYQKLIIKGSIFLGTASQPQMDKMYEATFTTADIKKLRTVIKGHLDFMLKIAKNENSRFANWDFHMYSRLYFTMLDYNGGKTPKIKDQNEFHDAVKLARGRIKNNQDRHPSDKKERTVASAFKGYLGDHGDTIKIKDTMRILLDELNLEYHIKDLDPERCYPREDLEFDWLTLDKKCFVLGVEIPFPECQGGHLKSHKNGGRLGKNIKPMYRPINNFMSDQNYNDFKKEHMPDGKIITKKLYDYMNRHASEKIKNVLKKAGILGKSNLPKEVDKTL